LSTNECLSAHGIAAKVSAGGRRRSRDWAAGASWTTPIVASVLIIAGIIFVIIVVALTVSVVIVRAIIVVVAVAIAVAKVLLRLGSGAWKDQHHCP
jgi:protein-S-isoprenylcysteine O-methyltransferase Ste14